MKRISMICMCLAAVFAFSAVAVASASATETLLFVPENGTFPVHFHSLDGAQKLVQAGGGEIKCTELHTDGVIEDAHLGKIHLLFLHCKDSVFNSACNSSGLSGGQILLEIGFHLGLAHKGTETKIPAILLLVGTFNFTCLSGTIAVKVEGEVIGKIESELNKQLTSLTVSFKQTGGTQELLEFLLALTGPPSELMTSDLKSTIGMGANELSGQEGEGKLLPLGTNVEINLKA